MVWYFLLRLYDIFSNLILFLKKEILLVANTVPVNPIFKCNYIFECSAAVLISWFSLIIKFMSWSVWLFFSYHCFFHEIGNSLKERLFVFVDKEVQPLSVIFNVVCVVIILFRNVFRQRRIHVATNKTIQRITSKRTE